jgi:hypothetical protein
MASVYEKKFLLPAVKIFGGFLKFRAVRICNQQINFLAGGTWFRLPPSRKMINRVAYQY